MAVRRAWRLLMRLMASSMVLSPSGAAVVVGLVHWTLLACPRQGASLGLGLPPQQVGRSGPGARAAAAVRGPGLDGPDRFSGHGVPIRQGSSVPPHSTRCCLWSGVLFRLGVRGYAGDDQFVLAEG